MLAFPQWHLFTAEYCTESVTYFSSLTVMLAFPQWHLFTVEYCTEPVTCFSLMNCHAGLSTVTLIYSWILHWTCDLFSLMKCHAGLSTVTLIYIWILHWICNLFSLMNCHAGLFTVTLVYSWILHWTCNLLFPHELSCWPFHSYIYLQLNTTLNLQPIIPSWTVMLAFLQSAFIYSTALHCTKLVSHCPLMSCHAALATVRLIYSWQHCTKPVTSYPLMTYHAGLATVRFIFSTTPHWTCNLFFSHELSCWPCHNQHLFTAEYNTELVTYFSLMNSHSRLCHSDIFF